MKKYFILFLILNTFIINLFQLNAQSSSITLACEDDLTSILKNSSLKEGDNIICTFKGSNTKLLATVIKGHITNWKSVDKEGKTIQGKLIEIEENQSDPFNNPTSTGSEKKSAKKGSGSTTSKGTPTTTKVARCYYVTLTYADGSVVRNRYCDLPY